VDVVEALDEPAFAHVLDVDIDGTPARIALRRAEE
jgi:hypothetical protein